MAVFKTISVKHIIAKIYRDLALEDPNYTLDFIEWMGEALAFIGSAPQYSRRNEEIVVTDFKGELPNLFVSLKQVKYKNPHKDEWELIEYNPRNFELHDDDIPNLKVKTRESFTIDLSYIITSFEEGELLISYRSIATDEDGYPLVPDNQYFKEGLFWFCYRQMILRGYKSRVETIDYHFADQKWQFYCGAARNKANFPSMEEYDRFRRTWVGLLPSVKLPSKGFDEMQRTGTEIETVDANNIVTTPQKIQTIIVDGGNSDSNFD